MLTPTDAFPGNRTRFCKAAIDEAKKGLAAAVSDLVRSRLRRKIIGRGHNQRSRTAA